MITTIDAILHCSDYAGLVKNGATAFPDYIEKKDGKITFKFSITPLIIKDNEALALIRCDKDALLGNGDDVDPLFAAAPTLTVLSWADIDSDDACPFEKLSESELVTYQNVWPYTNPIKFGEFAKYTIPKK